MPYVLIIEGESDLAALLAHHFITEGFLVAMAADGQAGLRSARQYSPDLVLLGLVLPRLTGWEVARALKTDAATRDIPIIVLSAIYSPEDRMRLLLEERVDDFIVKPCSVREVMLRARAALRRTGSTVGMGEGKNEAHLRARR